MALGWFTSEQDPMTYDGMQRKRLIAEALMAEGTSGGPIRSWAGGANNLAKALIGGYELGQYEKRDKELAAEWKARAEKDPTYRALMGLGASPSPAPVGMAASGGANMPGDMATWAAAIKKKESAGSGDYAAVGPTHPKLGRALGAYQVMEANIGPWSREALGREVTPDEFLRNPQIQDQIFQHKFGQYVQKFGNPQDAASAWFTGQPLSVGANRRDVLGTTGSQYVADFNRNIGQGGPAPVQVASLDGLPPGPVPSSAPPMAYASAPPSMASAMPPMPPPRPQGVGGPPAAMPGSAPIMPSGGFTAPDGLMSGAPMASPRVPSPAPAPMPNAPAPNAAPAGPAPMPQPPAQGVGIAPSALLQLAMDPRFSPQQRNMAMELYKQGQRDEGVTPVDLGDRVALLNKRGQVTGYMPKSQAPRGPIAVGPDQRLIDPNTKQEIAPAQGPSKLEREAAQREAEARRRGLNLDDPRTKQFILTGSYPREPELTVTDKNAILEADELVSSNRSTISTLQRAKELSKKAMGFTGSGMIASVAAPFSQTAQDTVELNNIMTEQALNQLKATFGGAPTEGERKILLEIQGSSSQPDAVRQKIFDRAIEAAQRRMKMNEEKAQQLRGRTYFTAPTQMPQATTPATPPAANADPAGAIAAARDAIAKGASREAVIKRLRDNGIDTTGL